MSLDTLSTQAVLRHAKDASQAGKRDRLTIQVTEVF